VALGVELDNKIAIKFYLGRDYYPWPHKDLMTHYDEFMADGTRTVGEEICAVLMKDLGLFQILRSVLRRRAKSGRGALLLAGR
jgi:hypothetical protein